MSMRKQNGWLVVSSVRSILLQMTFAIVILILLPATNALSIEYSGPNQNIILEKYNSEVTISIAGSESAWDNWTLNMEFEYEERYDYIELIHYSGPRYESIPPNDSLIIDIADSLEDWDDWEIETGMWGDAAMDGDLVTYALVTHGSMVKSSISADWDLLRLNSEALIDATRNYSDNAQFFYYSMETGETVGNFFNQMGYVGLMLEKDDDQFFGWALAETENCDNEWMTLTIHEWAFRNQPGESITAGLTSDQIPGDPYLTLKGANTHSHRNNQNNKVKIANHSYLISKFNEGDLIGSSHNYNYSELYIFLFLSDGEGHFYNQSGYVGLQLQDGESNVYYGWAYLSTDNCSTYDATVTIRDWAFNSNPGEPIIAGAKERTATYSGTPYAWYIARGIEEDFETYDTTVFNDDGYTGRHKFLMNVDNLFDDTDYFKTIGFSVSNGRASVTIPHSKPDRRYRIKGTPTLSPADWTSITNSLGTGGVLILEIPDEPEPIQFYRGSVELP